MYYITYLYKNLNKYIFKKKKKRKRKKTHFDFTFGSLRLNEKVSSAA